MADPSEQLQTCRNRALLAIEAEDWGRVVTECLKAELILSTIPDSRIGNMSDIEWSRTSIRQLRERAEQMVNSGDGCGLDICNVEYVGLRGTSGGCAC